MDEETIKLVQEILWDKFALEIIEEEIWLIEKPTLLLCHIVKGAAIEFEFKFRDTQVEYGKNITDATAKFSAKDTPIEPVFTGKWKLV